MKPLRNMWQKWLTGAAMLLVILSGFTLVAQDAEAKRLGGGKSFGQQSQNVTRQQSAPTRPQNATTTPSPSSQPAAPQPAGNRWLGPLAGLAAGIGLASLFSHFGMGGDASGLLMLALLAFGGFALWRMFAARNAAVPAAQRNSVFSQSPMQPALQTSGSSSSSNVYGAPMQGTPESAAPEAPWNVPVDFDVPGFLRSAKVNFTRLQAAWDAKDLNDIRQFTTPEVFAEIKMQHDESSGATDKTDIVQLDAVLLGIETTPTEYLASVRFTGTLRENGGNPEPIAEVWNLAKPVNGRSGWLLAGIQQLQ